MRAVTAVTQSRQGIGRSKNSRNTISPENDVDECVHAAGIAEAISAMAIIKPFAALARLQSPLATFLASDTPLHHRRKFPRRRGDRLKKVEGLNQSFFTKSCQENQSRAKARQNDTLTGRGTYPRFAHSRGLTRYKIITLSLFARSRQRSEVFAAGITRRCLSYQLLNACSCTAIIQSPHRVAAIPNLSAR